MTQPKNAIYIRSKTHGTRARIIRTVVIYDGLAFKIEDLTYGGFAWLPIDKYIESWEVYDGP